MKYYQKFFGHLRNIIVHKHWVFIYCCKFGIPWQGIIHDLSKFSPTEFFESVKYFQGDASPIPVCKKLNGYSKVWQHHKGRNKHHYEYWTDNYDNGTTFIEIPSKYVLELLADWFAAGRTYHGKNFTENDEYDWWVNKRDNMHPAINVNTLHVIDKLMLVIKHCDVNSIKHSGGVKFVDNIYNDIHTK